jgi:hypothetical protein
MAWEQPILDVGYEAAEDLSGNQYRFVVLDVATKKIRRPDSAYERPEGILQNNPSAGQRGQVRVAGYSKLWAGGPLAMNDLVGVEFVDATDAGKGIALPAAAHVAYATVVEPCAAEDQLATVKLFPGGTNRRKVVSVSLPNGTPNTTVNTGVLAVARPMKVTRISVCAFTIPVDADGTLTLQVFNYDSSADATRSLMSAAFNLETLTAAKKSQDMTLTATSADLLLDPGDYIYAAIVSNSAAIDTPMAGAVVSIEYEERDF